MNTKIISAIFGFIVGLIGMTIFSGSIIFGLIGGIAAAIVIFILQLRNG